MMFGSIWFVLLLTTTVTSSVSTSDPTRNYPKLDSSFKTFCSGFRNFLNCIIVSSTQSGRQPIPCPNDTIYNILLKLNATVFLELITKANLLSIVKNPRSNFTVFAPINGNLKKISDNIKNNISVLNKVLRFHLVPGGRKSSSFKSNGFLKTLSKYGVGNYRRPLYIRTNIYKRQPTNLITVSGSKIIQHDNTNGMAVVYTIEDLMFPLPEENAYNEIQQLPKFSIFQRLVSKSIALIRVLSANRRNLTIFAPTDEAFKNMPAETLQNLENNVPLLTQTLVQTIVSQIYYEPSFMHGMTVTGIDQNTLKLKLNNNAFILTDGKTEATITGTDISVLNGVIHSINKVFLKQHNSKNSIIG